MKIKKNIIFIILIILISISNISVASIDPENFEPNKLTEQDYEKAFEMVGTIVSSITTLGTVISVIMVIVLGIKYLTSSVEQKAEYKKSMIPMIIGAILLFAGCTIVSIIYEMVTSIK